MQAPVHRIAMQIACARPQPCTETLAQHAHHTVERNAAQLREWPCATHQRKQCIFIPVFACSLGYDLLRKYVDRRQQNAQGIQLATAHAVQQRGAFDQLVARLRKQPCLRRATDRMSGAPGALQERCDRPRRTELTHQIDIADIQAKFQRCGRHQHGQLAGFEPLFG